MPDRPDVIVVGAGLAGACTALALASRWRVHLLDRAGPAAGASGVAAGLANPLMARRARPVWQMETALDALSEMVDGVGATWAGKGLLRPARDPQQAAWFAEAAAAHPDHAAWLAPDAATGGFPYLAAPHGALHVRSGGALDVADLTEKVVAALVARGGEVRTGARIDECGETDPGAWVRGVDRDGSFRSEASHVILAVGYGFRRFPELARLDLHAVKGQVVRVERPAGLAGAGLLPLSGSGYVVPDGDTLLVGSSYEHTFEGLAPSPEASRAILRQSSAMLPALREARVVEARAGVRVTVPRSRLPMVGRLPGRQRLWVVTGLGSKGLLMAPLVGRRLAALFAHAEALPAEWAVRPRP